MNKDTISMIILDELAGNFEGLPITDALQIAESMTNRLHDVIHTYYTGRHPQYNPIQQKISGEHIFGIDKEELLKQFIDPPTDKLTPVRIGQSYDEAIADHKNKQDDLEKALFKLKELTEIQCSPGNYDCDEYMRGMANGMILAVSVFEDNNPVFIEARGKPVPTDEPDKSNDDGEEQGLRDMAGANITAKQAEVLDMMVTLREYGGELTMAGIADAMETIPQNIRGKVQRLNDMGYIKRDPKTKIYTVLRLQNGTEITT